MNKKLYILLTLSCFNKAAEQPSRVPSLISLSAQVVADNFDTLNDDLVATDNHDIMQLVVSRVALYKFSKRLKIATDYKNCSGALHLTEDSRVIAGIADAEDGKVICFPEDPEYQIRRYKKFGDTKVCSSMLSRNDKYLVTIEQAYRTAPQQLLIYDVQTNQALYQSDIMQDHKFVSNGDIICFKTWVGEHIVRVLDLNSLPLIKYKDLLHADADIRDIVISNDGTKILTCDNENSGKAYLWDNNFDNKKCITSIALDNMYYNYFGAMSFSNDGKFFAIATGNRLLLFNRDGKELHNFGRSRRFWQDKIDYNYKEFKKCFFSHDGNRIIVGSAEIKLGNHYLDIFDINSKALISTINLDSYPHIIQWYDKFIVDGAVYTDAGVKLFDLARPSYVPGHDQKLEIIDSKTLLNGNIMQQDDGSYYELDEDSGHYDSVAWNRSKVAFKRKWSNEINVYEREKLKQHALEQKKLKETAKGE
ncbi:hypothetical protein A3F66_06615 [candidate division TM6 bacterium RIFCSPHIGHO2_12_FULL_32_22]|nr:MAG: hypothetical protein A3F66_06615 [candidate division TM6 bacterium RIFCSPHIGHO2_12_FULL_32_22]